MSLFVTAVLPSPIQPPSLIASNLFIILYVCLCVPKSTLSVFALNTLVTSASIPRVDKRTRGSEGLRPGVVVEHVS